MRNNTEEVLKKIEFLKYLKEKLGLSQVKLAKKLDITENTLRALFQGRNVSLCFFAIAELLDSYGLSQEEGLKFLWRGHTNSNFISSKDDKCLFKVAKELNLSPLSHGPTVTAYKSLLQQNLNFNEYNELYRYLKTDPTYYCHIDNSANFQHNFTCLATLRKKNGHSHINQLAKAYCKHLVPFLPFQANMSHQHKIESLIEHSNKLDENHFYSYDRVKDSLYFKMQAIAGGDAQKTYRKDPDTSYFITQLIANAFETLLDDTSVDIISHWGKNDSCILRTEAT